MSRSSEVRAVDGSYPYNVKCMRSFRRHATHTTAATEFRFWSAKLGRIYKLIFGGAPFVLNINQSDNLKEYTPGLPDHDLTGPERCCRKI